MYAIITSSPNTDGLTAACGKAALRGIENSGGAGQIIDLCREKIESCLTCEDGWGDCIRENRCVIDDCLPMLQETLKAVSYTHLRAHETDSYLVCRLLL